MYYHLLSGGYQEFSIDAADLTTGVYLYSLTNNNSKLSTGKFTIVK
jgi:hypothetical protein